jgi:hypothetical protein
VAQATGKSGRFTLAIVDGPAPGDHLVEVDEVRIFLDAAASSRLASWVLDVERHFGKLRFVLRPRTGESPRAPDALPPSTGGPSTVPRRDVERPTEQPQPDFARGQRQRTGSPVHGDARPDFARGQRERPRSVGEYERRHPDFARGQERQSELTPEHQRRGSFATGQEADA